jgi:mannose-6-phosphate isomerase-like protein (cupin superfamily)
MQSLIFCDGYGKNRTVFEDKPNALIELKPGLIVMDKLLLDIVSAGINQAVLMTDFKSETIKRELGTEHKGVELAYKKAARTFKNTAETIGQIDDDVVVIDAGVITDINFKKMMIKFEQAKIPIMIYTTHAQKSSKFFEVSNNGFVDSEVYDEFGGIFCIQNDYELSPFELGDEIDELFPTLADIGDLAIYSEYNFYDTFYTEDGKARILKEFQYKTPKPWGYEKILIYTDLYLLKELFLKEGYQSSCHYHMRKDETMLIIQGTGYIQFEDRREYFIAGDTIHIKPNERHTIVASTNTVLHEVSTPFLEDTTRVKDYYPVR